MGPAIASAVHEEISMSGALVKGWSMEADTGLVLLKDKGQMRPSSSFEVPLLQPSIRF